MVQGSSVKEEENIDNEQEENETVFPEYDDITRDKLIEIAEDKQLDILESDEYLSKGVLYDEVKKYVK